MYQTSKDRLNGKKLVTNSKYEYESAGSLNENETSVGLALNVERAGKRRIECHP